MNTGPIRPSQPIPPAPGAGKEQPAPKGGFNPGWPAVVPSAGGAASATPAFGTVRTLIETGLEAGRSREQILGDLVRGELETVLGPKGPPSIAARVAEAAASDPWLSRIADRLFAASKPT